ncbi:deoxyribose-phosphate aldolase [Suttonella ornithocola]|uniref:Deoxyribose-phosphate aldolase n=1 Tax=Suttonella ornithocola TaxID=279832 RepID=A0A380MVB6_9GAMM|nr:deoxyribose-phosphate aldolase [Suttonella ornithocola]SUO96238.1 Deoxyribose-phosphate aldolase [Suttonella ornithocola]
MQNADIVKLIDLTSLNDNDTPEVIDHLCQQATTPLGNVAAVCVYPQFVKQVDDTLLGIPVATVVNFPAATDSLDKVLKDTEQALKDGADEIDLVLPYRDSNENSLAMVKAVKKLCLDNNALLKVIIESGAFDNTADIKNAAAIAIDGGADFVKTSTGKIAVGATPEAAKAICEVLAEKGVSDSVGIKISGGVRTPEEANMYLEIITQQFGRDWITPHRVRIGASSLLNALLEK